MTVYEPRADEHVDNRVPANNVPEDGEGEESEAGAQHEDEDARDGDCLDDGQEH
ncbi:MAG: hypothetical protein ACYCSX_03355 [Acidimicrobiales bacterium]